MDTNKIVIASTRKNAGKTSLIIGLAKAMQQKIGYLKPLGDRLFYRKKRLYDGDYALLVHLFGLTEAPEDVTIGFDHSKLRYMFNEETTKNKLRDLVVSAGLDKDLLLIECGKDLTTGGSVHLDAISVTKAIDGKLLLVISGDSDSIMDDVVFVHNYCQFHNIDFRGVVANKVKDVEEFNSIYLEMISELGVPVLGVLPYKSELTQFTVQYLADKLLAKVIAGEDGLDNVVEHHVVGAMSANIALRLPIFQQENKIVITGGDRTDMILAALDTNSAGVVLTGNIPPTARVISKASDLNIPLLLVAEDTFRAAQQLHDMEVLISKDDSEKIKMLEQLIKKHVNIKSLIDN